MAKRADEARKTKVREQARERKRRQRARGATALAPRGSVPRATKQARPESQKSRVASRTKRDRFSALAWGNRLVNSDPTLVQHSRGRGIGLYTLILHQFANVAGFAQAWVDHVLVTMPSIKSAKASNPEDQTLADEARDRAERAWVHVTNRIIVLQKLLFGRFYGFSRAEKVARFDEAVGEWIPDLYDVPQEVWSFDDEGREFMIDSLNPTGVEVDPSKFIHFQWGSADSKYGSGALSEVHLPLWKIQKLETMALQRIEDSESTVIVHVPREIVGDERTDLEQAYADEFRKVILVPSNEAITRTELPTLSVTTSASAGRQEYEGVRFYERWIQTHLLGAPQTGDKSLGTGKLEDVRQGVWDDKTPIGRSALDQCMTDGWMSTYCNWNLPDLPMDLRPRFESDAVEITDGLSGAAAEAARGIGLDLVAERITSEMAVELWSGLGIPRARAQVMADSAVRQRENLAVVAAPAVTTAPQPAPQQDAQEAAA